MEDNLVLFNDLAKSYGLVVTVLLGGIVMLLGALTVIWREWRKDSVAQWDTLRELTNLVKQVLK